ncbi:MAG: GntR family transcriptional regulator [Armatimonadetes bacterium]|nr:GntR family transcriptional regulator [Armatimonadota bacterium]MBS1702250.1 GntR family transcriptional regulator [Armatimonadota bacterium]MBS1727082.1 GntR family transcriptional regulator [Armatimonadota bacterium]
MAKSLSPTVAATVNAIRQGIQSGTYAYGSFLPAEQEMANQIGVSRGTVRLAIQVLADAGDITRVQHSRPVVGIHRDIAPVTKGTEVHVWVSHPIADEATLRFMKGISAGLLGTGFRMIVREPTRFFGNHVKSDERQFLSEILDNQNVVGAIVQRDPYADNSDIIREIVRRGKPLVFADCPAPDGILADHVGTANLSAARQCVQYLMKLGHRDIVCAADNETPRPALDRIQGYKRAMQQAGLGDHTVCLVADNMPNPEGEPWQLAGRYVGRLSKNSLYSAWAHRLASKILSLTPRPTAVFVTCDVLAFWLISFLEGAGVSVPNDMSVIGFDGLSRWDNPENDTLTTACQDFLGFGKYASDLLLDRITGIADSAPRHILLEAPLVIRSSTKPELSVTPNGKPADPGSPP